MVRATARRTLALSTALAQPAVGTQGTES